MSAQRPMSRKTLAAITAQPSLCPDCRCTTPRPGRCEPCGERAREAAVVAARKVDTDHEWALDFLAANPLLTEVVGLTID